MTPLNGKALKRETGRAVRGRMIVVELFAWGCTTREKGKRSGYSVDWQAVHDLGAKLKAREAAALKAAAKKGKKR